MQRSSIKCTPVTIGDPVWILGIGACTLVNGSTPPFSLAGDLFAHVVQKINPHSNAEDPENCMMATSREALMIGGNRPGLYKRYYWRIAEQ
ncbi:uncharacterized protein BCR38DRAFT_425276 [Pseudomassariella vexata]|uniref:Uncharacterized protein n=1 Tax=Pseudomassariella vexata TaxID=1141098 RepID=A0A1Y2EC00_9PEZI|nr:uncharacterized protein BCR38DRAFT_425276 [Pseudomassariella vexata]ORY69091.1 hypothetical protein BCR38DRAFT_425276 [Pseudomassariella vexata]